MDERSRVKLLVGIMTVIAILVGITAILFLYQTAFEQEENRLVETVKSQARLLEAMARFNRQHSREMQEHAQHLHQDGEPNWPESPIRTDPEGYTIDQIREAHRRYPGFGQTGEFTLARRQEEQIVFVLRHRGDLVTPPPPIAWDSLLAEPMRRALGGQSGAMVGLDYRGVRVLAAYEPVRELNLGMVAKIDLEEVRRPFVHSALAVLVVTIALVGGGALIFLRIILPILRQLRSSEERYRALVETIPHGIEELDTSFTFIFANPASHRLRGYAPGSLIGQSLVEMAATEEEKIRWRNAFVRIMQENPVPTPFEGLSRHQDGSIQLLRADWDYKRDHRGAVVGIVAVITDQTEHKRLLREQEANEQRLQAQLQLVEMAALPMHEMQRFVLEQALTLTDSQIGFLGLLDESGETLLSHVLRMGDFLVREGPILLDVARGGFWTESLRSGVPLIDNDFSSPHSSKKGLPEGHPPLHRFLSVPIMEGNRPRAIIAVANKEGAYDSDDVDQLTLLMAGMWQQIKRRQAEEALRQSEENFRQLAENIEGVFWLAKRDPLQILYVSPAFARIWGISCAELLRNSSVWFEAIVPEDRPLLQPLLEPSCFREGADSRRGFRVEYRIRRPDGVVRWIRDLAYPVRDRQGELIRVAGIATDITGRKQNEAEILKNTQRMEALVHLASSLTNFSEADLLQYGLDEAVRLTGSRIGYLHFIMENQEDVELVTWTGEVMSTCRADHQRHYPLSQAGIWADCLRYRKAIFHNDYEALPDKRGLPEGHVPIHRHASVPVVEENQNRMILGVGNKEVPYDESDTRLLQLIANDLWRLLQRRRADARLRESETALRHREAQFYALLTAIPWGILGLDTMGGCIYANPAAAAILGYAGGEELLGAPIHDLVHAGESSGEGCLRPDCQFLAHGEEQKPHAHRDGLRRRDGVVIPVEIGCGSVVQEGEQVGKVVAFADIRERLRLEEELHHAQKMEAIGTLTGGIAHDFNNILSIVLGYTDMASRTLGAESKERHFLDEVYKAGLRARDLVAHLLTFGRRQGDERKGRLLPAPILKEVVKFSRAVIPTTIDLHLTLENEQCAVIATPSQLHQVLMNLITNAHHAMEEKGGVLEIGLRGPIPLTPRDIPEIRAGEYVVLTVRDSGHGIPHALLERIFDPFFTTKEIGKGTGLGLAMVHGIVAELGGAIRVTTQVGEGSTFLVYLPSAQMPEEEAVPWKIDGEAQRNASLLVVDDETILLHIYQSGLESLGYRVTAFPDPQEALARFQAGPDDFDLVLLDYAMPELSGLRLATRMKEIRPDLPVAICSGMGVALPADLLREANPDAVWQKPMLLGDLAGEIDALLVACAKK